MLIDLKEVHEIAHIPEPIKFFLDLPCQHFLFEHVLSATLVVTATFAVQVDFANAFGHSAKQENLELDHHFLGCPRNIRTSKQPVLNVLKHHRVGEITFEV